jgi:hypothetical protein
MMTMTNINWAKSQNTDYMFMVEQAVKAPSGHNTQPWLFKLNDNSIEIHPNLNKSLPVVDFDNRELFISLGCATENLCITASAKGYESKIVIADEGIITINLVKNQAIVPDSLFAQIDVRQTNRSVYNGKIISDSTINKLKTIPLKEGVNLHFYKTGTPDFDLISNYVIEGNTIQMQDKAFKNELISWMRFNKNHSNKTKDGLSYAVFGAPNLPMFIVKPIMKKAINVKSQNKGDRKKMQSSSHFVLFTTQSNTLEEWVNLGRSMERLLLRSTEQDIIHAYLNQPNEIKDLSQKMVKTLGIPNEHPTILLRIGYGKKMPYSKRKEIKDLIIK